jgi:uncharacterized protein YqhQ
MSERTVYYGGQALIEGVMIRGPRSVGIACRRPDGGIVVRSQTLGGVYTGMLRRVPFLRGVIVVWETLVLGMRSLIYSSNVAMGEDDKDVSPLSVVLMGVSALALVVVLFFVGPVALTNWLDDRIGSDVAVIAIEGLVRLAMLVGYIGLVGLVPDIRRVYAYHGAEHKSIHALEAGDPLTPDSVQRHPTAHPRCGTSFLLTIVVVSVIVFVAIGRQDLWERIASRVVLIPVIAAVSYELIRLGGRFYDNSVARVLMWPNLLLQKLTTRQPDDAQVEVALRALQEVLAREREQPVAAGEAASPAEGRPPP